MFNFQDRTWRLATFLDKCSGYWPYDGWLTKGPILAYHFAVSFSFILSMAYNWIKNIGIDYLITIKCILGIMFVFGELCKLLGVSVYQNSRRRIYDKVFEHYREIVDEEEAKVLRDFVSQGLRYSMAYVGTCMSISAVFTIIPLWQTFVSYSSGDGQLIVKLPFELNYGVDINEHLLPIFIHFSMFMFTGIIISVAFDFSFILQVQHVCALIKIVTMRLERAAGIFGERETRPNRRLVDDEAHSLVRRAIELHGKSFELISLIEDEHNLCFFFMLLTNSAIFGGIIHLVSATINLEPIESFRHSLAFLLVLIHFYVLFSQGQKIIDCTSGIFVSCYDCQWYRLSKKLRVMWLIIMIRSSRPCYITGGKCFILSRETYSQMLKAGVSYYTVFEN